MNINFHPSNNYVEYDVSKHRSFFTKVKNFISAFHYTIKKQDQKDYKAHDVIYKSKKFKKRTTTYLSKLIKEHYQTDMIILFKFKKSKDQLLRTDYRGQLASQDFLYYNWMYHAQTDNYPMFKGRPTADKMIRLAYELLIERYGEMVRELGIDYDFIPLHSIIFKAI